MSVSGAISRLRAAVSNAKDCVLKAKTRRQWRQIAIGDSFRGLRCPRRSSACARSRATLRTADRTFDPPRKEGRTAVRPGAAPASSVPFGMELIPAVRDPEWLRSRDPSPALDDRSGFGLYSLPEHVLEKVAPDTVVVNPARPVVGNTIRNERGTLGRLHTQRARAGTGSQKKRDLAGRIREAERNLQALECAHKRAPEPMRAGDLTDELKLQALPAPLRQFHDPLRMIAYRAESRMAVAVALSMDTPETARSLLETLFHSDACLHPDAGSGTLTMRPPHLANRAHDRALAPLIDQLNRTRTVFPGTDLRLVYEMPPW